MSYFKNIYAENIKSNLKTHFFRNFWSLNRIPLMVFMSLNRGGVGFGADPHLCPRSYFPALYLLNQWVDFDHF